MAVLLEDKASYTREEVLRMPRRSVALSGRTPESRWFDDICEKIESLEHLKRFNVATDEELCELDSLCIALREGFHKSVMGETPVIHPP